jgi:hypothetical protein
MTAAPAPLLEIPSRGGYVTRVALNAEENPLIRARLGNVDGGIIHLTREFRFRCLLGSEQRSQSRRVVRGNRRLRRDGGGNQP